MKNSHGKVRKAKTDGTLVQGPCEVCGELKTVAHHDDYDKPLEVRWLCHSHHQQWHAAHGSGLNKPPARPNAPIPLQTAVTQELADRLMQAAREDRRSISAWIAIAVEEALDRKNERTKK